MENNDSISFIYIYGSTLILNIPILYSIFSAGILCGIQAIADTGIHRHKPLPAMNSKAHDDFWGKHQGQRMRTEIM